LHRDGRDQYWLMQIDQEVIAEAIELTRRHKLRGYDAVHLASALFLSRALLREGLTAPVLLSADRELVEAAQAEGLRVENPSSTLS
jgi:predicted nucleic acid-binding protein